MMKNFSLSALMMGCLLLSGYSQITLISEDFFTYNGTAGTVPAGWTFTYNGNYKSSFINSGCDSTAYKFGANNATITTPAFSGADTVSFWLKGTSGIDSANIISVMETADNTTWDTLAQITPVPTTGTTKKFGVKNTSVRLRFSYYKMPGGAGGNVGFDCFLLTGPEPVTANFSGSNICLGDSACFSDLSTTVTGTITEWHWDFGDGDTSIAQNPCHLFLTAGDFPVGLLVKNNSGQMSYKSINFTVADYPVATLAVSDSTACSGDSIVFTASPAGMDNYNFFVNGNSVQSDSSNLFSSNSISNNDSVSVLISNSGCSGPESNTIGIIINQTPVANAGMDKSICAGECVQLGASGGSDYLWLPASCMDTLNIPNPTACCTINDSMEFTVVVTNNFGCQDTDEVWVFANPNPVANFFAYEMDGGVYYNDSSLGNIVSWFWNFGDSTFSAEKFPSAHIYFDTAWYIITLTINDINGCSDSFSDSLYYFGSGSIEETVFSKSITISPNPTAGKFFIQSNGKLNPFSKIKISNILGETIFNSQFPIPNSQYSIDLTGQPEGTYFVTLQGKDGMTTRKIEIVR